jgi:hypothetical protein
MRKHLLRTLLISLVCLTVTAGFGQGLNEPPHAGILGIDESGFPENILEVFIYEPGIYPTQAILPENLILWQDSNRLTIQKLEKQPGKVPVSITMLVDSRISSGSRELIREQYELFPEMPDVKFKYFNISDFDERRAKREKRRAESGTDATIPAPVFPFLESFAKETAPDSTHLNIIFLKECTIYASELTAFLAQQRNRNYRQWYAFYFIESTDCHLISLPYIRAEKEVQNLLFSRIFNDSTFHMQMVQTIRALKKSHCRIHFSSSPVNSLENNFVFTLHYKGIFMDEQSELLHTFPQSLVEMAFLNHTLAVSDSLKLKGEYSEAHKILRHAYLKTNDPVLQNAGRELIVWEASKMLEKPEYDPFALFEQAELFWGFRRGTQLWILDLEAALLKDYYHKIGKFQPENRLKLLLRIHGIAPADFEFRDYYYHELGDHYLANTEFQLAAEAYLVIYEPDSASHILKDKLREALQGSFPLQYQQQEWSDLYNTGIKTHGLFRNNFEMNYYFGRSCREMQDFPRAYELFSFLVNNWKAGQNVITWNTLLSSLEELSIQTLNFSRALDMNMRIQRNEGGREHIEKYLLNMRIQDYYTLSRLLAAFCTRNGIRQNLNNIDKNYPGMIAPGINAIYVIDRQSSVLHTFYKKDKTDPPDITRIGSQKELVLRKKEEDNLLSHIIQAIDNDQYIVLELTNEKTDATRIAIRDIDNRHMINAPWDSIRVAERNANLKRTAIVFARAVQADQSSHGTVDLAVYNRASTGTDVEYLLLHKANGEVDQPGKFVRSKASYPPGGWEKSAATPAYYEQSIQYDDHKIKDIALPLYKDNNFAGVIRIGFKK